MPALWAGRCDPFELVDSAVGHQRQKEATVAHHVRPDEPPLLHDVIVQGPRGTCRAGQSQWAELELAGAIRCPGPASSIAINTRRQLSIGTELNCVLCAIVRRQRRVVAALEPDELP